MKGREAFYGNIYFKVGDGRRVSFLGQKWCGDLVFLPKGMFIQKVKGHKEEKLFC